MSDSDDDCLSRTMTSERSDAEYIECFGDSLRAGCGGRQQPRDPFAPSNDDDFYFDNHYVSDEGLYVSDLVAPPEDEFPIGCRVYIVADLRELKQTMGPYYFEEKMFRLLGGVRRIFGRVLRHHGDYTVVEFSVPLEDMFSGKHTRKLGGAGGFRRQSLQHRASISIAPNGQTLFPNVSSATAAAGRRDSVPNPLDSTCAPPAGAFDETQRTRPEETTTNAASASPPHPPHPEIKKLSLGNLNNNLSAATSSSASHQHHHHQRPATGRRSTLASPRTPRGGAALLSPRSAAAQAEKIIVSYTFHRSVIEVMEEMM